MSLLAIYVDGETKTGKGAAGKAIAAALEEKGHKVYYDIAGDFFRRYVVLVRKHLNLAETDALPTGPVLEEAAEAVHATRAAFRPDFSLGDLQRPIISQSVAVLGELPYVQKAGAQWWEMTLRLAQEAEADVLVVDARNPRYKAQAAAAATGITLTTAFDLFMTCDADEAAMRTLRLQGVTTPSAEQLAEATKKVELRREQDRNRPERPFVTPAVTIRYDAARMTANETVRASWVAHGDAELPIAVELDNTHFTEPEMLTVVRDLALAAVGYIQK